ncbi:MAG TPA: hypothetical protein DEA22_00930 [Blastocatellia bacterium]|nr:hypothetical protein [Blastocatellia bacterium]
MKNSGFTPHSEKGSAGAKFLVIFVALILAANAGYNYVPVAYEGANFKQEMDTAVVKGLAASGQMKPLEVVKASINRALGENNIPHDAVIEIKPTGSFIQARVVYSKPVAMLPFGLYTYRYDFDHTAAPSGYLTKQ